MEKNFFKLTKISKKLLLMFYWKPLLALNYQRTNILKSLELIVSVFIFK